MSDSDQNERPDCYRFELTNKSLSPKVAEARDKVANMCGNNKLGRETAAEQKRLQPLLRKDGAEVSAGLAM